MNTLLRTLTATFVIFTLTSCKSPNPDSVNEANAKNKKDDTSYFVELISPANVTFLVEMTDARMMDLAEGKLAARRGTTLLIRNYGKKMMLDQTQLLHEIRILGRDNGVALPTVISAEKQEALKELKKLKGKEFNKSFLTLIRRDHERDVKKFQAVQITKGYAHDDKVMAFANERLPLIQAHLTEVINISKTNVR